MCFSRKENKSSVTYGQAEENMEVGHPEKLSSC